MFTFLFKYFFIYVTNIVLCFRAMNHKFNKSLPILSIMYAFLLSIITSLFRINNLNSSYSVALILLWIFTSIVTSNPYIAFPSCIIAFGISYALFAISSLIIVIISSLFSYESTESSYFIITVISGVLQLILTYFFYQLKRFQKGMPILFSKAHLKIIIFLCLLLLGFCTPVPLQADLNFKILILFTFIITLSLLIFWWQAQITKSYKQALVQRELESLRTELQEKDRLLAEISAKNEELGRLIHKDNKRIPAMEHAVSEFLVMDFSTKEAAIERANALLLEIKELAQDRDNTITEIYASKFKHHNTGISSLDTMLNYMEKRAHNEHIKLSVNIALDLNRFVPDTITTEDLTHVLSDLLENAIIAAKQNASPVIQLQFYQAGKDFVIEIADNGNPFEANILVNYGLEQLTTHADTGGSGIGLMDIWKIKEKYGTSLHITEYESNAPYTKKIALIFNKKNRYTISTERKEELLTISRRSDLQIF